MTVLQPLWLRREDTPELPEGWQALTIVEATDQLKPGRLYDTKTSLPKGEVPVVNQALNGFVGYHSDEPGVFASAGAPVVTFANHTCAMRLMKQPFSCIQNIFPKVGREDVCDTRYFYYAAMGRVDLSDYKGHHPLFRQAYIPVPPLSTQQRIATILSAYDDLIENNMRRIEILEEMARRLYEEWFVRFRFPGHEEVKFNGELPKGWVTTPLGEVCKKITDGAHKSPQTATSGLPMASVKDMHSWGLDISNSRLISSTDFEELVRNHCKPQINDILVAKDGANLNKHTFLVTEEVEVVLLSSIAILRPSGIAHPEFLVAQLKSEEVSQRIRMMKSGAAIPRIVLKDFKRLDVLVPPRAIQEHWVAHAGAMHDLCRALVRKNGNLLAQRDLLLPKLISGEIDVTAAMGLLEAAE